MTTRPGPASSATCWAASRCSPPMVTPSPTPTAAPHARRSYVTSAGAGPSIGKHILMTYLPPEHAVVGNSLKVQYMGEQYPVTVATNDPPPVFDAENARVRS